jgi:protein phosphatase
MDDLRGLYLVADGMGGHQAGEVASTLVIRSIRDFVLRPAGEPETPERNGRFSPDAGRLLAGIEWSNRVVHEAALSRDDYRGMGSTIAAVYFSDQTLIAANVGDSPIYLLRNGSVELLSVPHTLQNDLALEPCAPFMGNVLTRAVGPKKAVEADLCELNCFRGDVLVMCSDGLSTKVSPPELLSIAGSRPPAEACRRLVELANLRGGDDNISTVVLHVNAVCNRRASMVGRWFRRLKRRLTTTRTQTG